jgi:hypothetical protein
VIGAVEPVDFDDPPLELPEQAASPIVLTATAATAPSRLSDEMVERCIVIPPPDRGN